MLTLTLEVRPGETPTSFASRLAARNLRDNVRTFCSDMGLAFSGLVTGEKQAVEAICDLAGVDSAAFENSTFVADSGRSYLLNKQRITQPLLQRQGFPCCPRCLIDDFQDGPALGILNGYGRAIWNLAPYRICVHHNVPIQEMVHPFVQSRSHDVAFHIRDKLEAIERLASNPPESRPVSDYERYIIDRIAGAERQKLWLDELDFSAATQTCEMFGAVAVFGPRPNLKTISDADRARAGAAGFELFKGGLEAARDFLSELQRAPSLPGTAGPQQMYGRIYQWLAFGGRDPGIEPVREFVRDHIMETLPIAKGVSVLGETLVQRRLHSIRSLSVDTNVHPTTLRKALRHSRFIEGDNHRLDHHVVFPAAEAEVFARKFASGINKRAVGELLKVPRVHLTTLTRSRYLTPMFQADGMETLYDPLEVYSFISGILDGAEVIPHRQSHQLTIPEAVKKACCQISEVLDLLTANELNWIGRWVEHEGYLSILVDINEVKQKVQLPDADGIAVSAIANDFGITSKGVSFLLSSRMLPTESAISPTNRCPMRIVPTKDYERFKQTFVSLRDLARSQKKASRVMLADLTARNIRPLPEARSHSAYIFRRSDLR